ncbi:MAG: ROK family protein [Verrucomicrobiota bacterium]|nr:ROK family protein [Verrucomicrobiota bacterium]
MAKKISVGIDLGGTKIMAVIFDENFNVLGAERVPTEGHKGSKDGLKRILRAVDSALESSGNDKDEVVACGIGCPGVVDYSNGVLREAANLGWEDVEIGRYLSKKIDAEVAVLNDVDAGTYGEYHLGAAQGAHSVFGVFPGTGVGGGFVYDGEILRGKTASCMEFGRYRMLGSTLEGAHDEPVALEALCGRLGVAASCVIEASRGNASSIMEIAGTDIRKVKSGTIKKSIDAGEDNVLQIMKRSIHYLGIGVTSVVELLAPEVVVLGGGLVEKMPELYLEGIKDAVHKYGSKALADGVDFRVAKKGDLAVAIGAASYALEYV